jgi:chromosome segregation ATPase
MKALPLVLLLLCASGCSSLYYAGLEKVGIPKRDLLSRRVERARDAQEETKEQVGSALDRFRATVRVEGGELEKSYDQLRSELEKSEEREKQLGSRIDDVESVAEALFSEWEDELDQYKRPELRAQSARRLAETRRDYAPMIKSMRRAHKKVEPVLDAFRDVVLALKHQLNARAIAGMQGELASVEREVDALVREMNDSIREAGKFLGTLEQPVGDQASTHALTSGS